MIELSNGNKYQIEFSRPTLFTSAHFVNGKIAYSTNPGITCDIYLMLGEKKHLVSSHVAVKYYKDQDNIKAAKKFAFRKAVMHSPLAKAERNELLQKFFAKKPRHDSTVQVNFIISKEEYNLLLKKLEEPAKIHERLKKLFLEPSVLEQQ